MSVSGLCLRRWPFLLQHGLSSHKLGIIDLIMRGYNLNYCRPSLIRRDPIWSPDRTRQQSYVGLCWSVKRGWMCQSEKHHRRWVHSSEKGKSCKKQLPLRIRKNKCFHFEQGFYLESTYSVILMFCCFILVTMRKVFLAKFLQNKPSCCLGIETPTPFPKKINLILWRFV